MGREAGQSGSWLTAAIFAVVFAAGFLGTMIATEPARATTTSFDIELQLDDGMTDAQQAAFHAAESFFENIISGYAAMVTAGKKLVVAATIEAIDGAGGKLGSAGPWSTFKSGGYAYSNTGRMRFDSSDIGRYTGSRLVDLIVHELAHVIGVGTLWIANGVYRYGTGQYTGQAALEAYRAETGEWDATYVPVELDGGMGTANSHWDEGSGLGRTELMTGWFDSGSTFGATSIASLVDLGYVLRDRYVPDEVPIPLPPAAPLLITGLAAFVGARRRDLPGNP